MEKKCGNDIQTDDCDLMEISVMNKLVQDETTKIEGTAKNYSL